MSKRGRIAVRCDGIACDSSVDLQLPEGWIGNADAGGEGSTLYCADCQPQRAWFRSLCPGCVEGFHDCAFGRAFMYDRSPGLTEAQRATIGGGRCPFRTNGTVVVRNGVANDLDLSDCAPAGSGDAVLAAVDAYAEKYR